MKVEILTTPGCSNCRVLQTMLDEIKIPYEVIDVSENPEYLEKHPIFVAPALIINGKLHLTGIPKKEKLKEIFY